MDTDLLDDEDGDPIGGFGYWGTLLCYAASEYRGAKVIWWLIDKSADPGFGKGDGCFNAWWVAKFQGNVKVLAELGR